MKELLAIQSKLKAPKGNYNNYGKYKYRSCEDILEAVKPLLEEQKCLLTISDDIKEVAGRVYIHATVTISNEDGDNISVSAFAREAEHKSGMDEAQVTGAASSYARKYALNGLFCIDDTKDPDALNTTKEYTQARVATKTQQPQPVVDEKALAEAIQDLQESSSDRDALLEAWNRHSEFQKNGKFKAEASRIGEMIKEREAELNQ